MPTTNPTVRLVAQARESATRYTDTKVAMLQSEITKQGKIIEDAKREEETRKANLKIMIRLVLIATSVGLSITLDAYGITRFIAIIVATSPDITREIVERVRKL